MYFFSPFLSMCACSVCVHTCSCMHILYVSGFNLNLCLETIWTRRLSLSLSLSFCLFLFLSACLPYTPLAYRYNFKHHKLRNMKYEFLNSSKFHWKYFTTKKNIIKCSQQLSLVCNLCLGELGMLDNYAKD